MTYVQLTSGLSSAGLADNKVFVSSIAEADISKADPVIVSF